MDFDALRPAFDAGWVTDVRSVVKSGKEATVYLCRGGARSGEDLLAAKVYRSREQRTFRNDAAYLEGGMRAAGRRVKLAAAKKTGFGRQALFARWMGREFETLTALKAAGASVPRPVASLDGLVLLSWIGEGEEAAPPLRHVDLDRPRALALLETLLEQVELFLACNTVHGDLSEYNVLLYRDQPVIIDFPQAVDARFNRNARELLGRDLRNLARFFSRHGARLDADRFAAELWRRWLRSELQADAGAADPALTWVDTRFARS